MSRSGSRAERRAAARASWRRPPLPLWAALLAAVAGGLLLDAAFPSLGIWPLAFVAIALQLIALIGRRAWSALLVGAAFGAAFYLPHISWLDHFLGDDPLRWVPWVALAVVESVFTGAGAVLISLGYRVTDRWRGWLRIAAVPALIAGLWTLRENIIGSWPYGGFAWGRIGMVVADAGVARVASWVGVAGLSFLLVAVCALAIELVRVYRREGRTLSVPSAVLAPVPLAGLLVVLFTMPAFPTAPSGTLSVAAVQGNGPTAYLDDREYLDAGRAQLEASGGVADADVDVVLWPEGALGGDPRGEAQANALASAAELIYGAPVLLNAASAEGDDIYNMSMLWEGGAPTQTHSKRHPVPFGEYVPERAIFERIVPSLIGMLQREYTAGTDSPVFDVAGARVGLAICFDVISDSLIREGIDGGAQAFMFQTNNADFRGTDENLQQLAFARMRAVETGRTVVNLSTVGVSEIIAPDGTTIDRIGTDEAGTMIADVELRDGRTAAVVIGPWLSLLVSWGAFGALIVIALARRERGSAAPGA